MVVVVTRMQWNFATEYLQNVSCYIFEILTFTKIIDPNKISWHGTIQWTIPGHGLGGTRRTYIGMGVHFALWCRRSFWGSFGVVLSKWLVTRKRPVIAKQRKSWEWGARVVHLGLTWPCSVQGLSALDIPHSCAKMICNWRRQVVSWKSGEIWAPRTVYMGVTLTL